MILLKIMAFSHHQNFMPILVTFKPQKLRAHLIFTLINSASDFLQDFKLCYIKFFVLAVVDLQDHRFIALVRVTNEVHRTPGAFLKFLDHG